MKYALTAVATLAALAILALLFPYSGLYNVSAAEGHTEFLRWYLDTTANHSIKARADDITAPPDLTDSIRVVRGAGNFDAMCVVCHGAPGVERGEIGKGITPTPPRLSEAATMWSSEEIYWILEHGIKLAGMPAFGETHGEEELWDLAAFVDRLPEMTPERYRMLVAVAPGHHGAGGSHDHTEADSAAAASGDPEDEHADDGHAH